MYEIVSNIYLGDIKDVGLGRDVCESIVSVYNGPIDLTLYTNSISVSIEDSPTSDLLSNLPRLVEFISLHKNEKVLIHCFAGSSRSVATLLAYLLSENLIESIDEGLDLIVSKGGSPNPNDGFVDQLQLWIQMGCRINSNHIAYKEFKLKQYQEAALLADGGGALNELVAQAPSERDVNCWKCKKCRISLFRTSSIIPHDRDAKIKQFHKKSGDKKPKVKCSSVFTEPITWMAEIQQGNVKGNLSCPKCKQKVGHFDWSGMQCSCGKWVSPAIQVQLKQVDQPVQPH